MENLAEPLQKNFKLVENKKSKVIKRSDFAKDYQKAYMKLLVK